MKNQNFFLLILLQLLMPVLLYAVEPAQPTEVVKIGLLITDPEAVAAKNGAEMAMLEINKRFKSHKFQLIARTMEGAWGAGGNEAVKLIFDDKVVAIVGSHDGRNAHLVEQAATKSGVVFISAWAGDPTLSQAFVPWFFNISPNNDQQSEALLKEIHAQGLKNIALITDHEYDSKTASNSFLRLMKEKKLPLPEQYQINESAPETKKVVEQMAKTKALAVIIFTKPTTAKKLVKTLQVNKSTTHIFAPLILLNENEIAVKDLAAFENLILVSSNHSFSASAAMFRANYQELYKTMPGNVAAFAYDAAQVLMHSIITAGTDREMIQKTLLEKQFNGVTGPIQFDKRGNRNGNVTLVRISNGIPVELKK